jgi:hypothetical protein
VNYSPAFRWTVGLLIPVTLAWKISVGADNPNEFTDRIADFLARRGFAVTSEEAMGGVGMWLIRASRGECRMFIVNRLGTGWTRQLMASHEEATDRNFIVFRGEIYDGDPTWLTASTDIYFRMLRRLGLGRSALVVGVAASPTCDAERLAWNEL